MLRDMGSSCTRQAAAGLASGLLRKEAGAPHLVPPGEGEAVLQLGWSCVYDCVTVCDCLCGGTHWAGHAGMRRFCQQPRKCTSAVKRRAPRRAQAEGQPLSTVAHPYGRRHAYACHHHRPPPLPPPPPPPPPPHFINMIIVVIASSSSSFLSPSSCSS